ncbi:hypothetical protein DFS34DRAFT_694052 [Phlyctochytrium arcticum]|nr:hypothetical protein DFS34DRAFT_694052 [Phlyctochytrium arcticum]
MPTTGTSAGIGTTPDLSTTIADISTAIDGSSTLTDDSKVEFPLAGAGARAGAGASDVKVVCLLNNIDVESPRKEIPVLPTELWITILNLVGSPVVLWQLRLVNSVFHHVALAAIYTLYTGRSGAYLKAPDQRVTDATEGSKPTRSIPVLVQVASAPVAKSHLTVTFSLPSRICCPEPVQYHLLPHIPVHERNGLAQIRLPTLHFQPDDPTQDYTPVDGFRGFADLVVRTAAKIRADAAQSAGDAAQALLSGDEWSRFTEDAAFPSINHSNVNHSPDHIVGEGHDTPKCPSPQPGQIKNHLCVIAAFLRTGRADLMGHVGNFSAHLRFSYDLLLGTYDRICGHPFVRPEPQLSLLALTWRVIEVIAPATQSRDLKICMNPSCCRGILNISFRHSTWTFHAQRSNNQKGAEGCTDDSEHPYNVTIQVQPPSLTPELNPEARSEVLWDGTYGKVTLTRVRKYLGIKGSGPYLEFQHLSHSESEHTSLSNVSVVTNPLWLMKGELLDRTSGIEHAIKQMEEAMEKAVEALQLVSNAFETRARPQSEE